MDTVSSSCYCGNPMGYAACCAKAHQDLQTVTTAEALMRSRYSAFVRADGDYLMQSHHPSTRPVKEKKSIVRWAKSVQWIRLEVMQTSKGQLNDMEGFVEFKAYFFEEGQVQVIHEHSRFLKENGVWLYVDAK